MKKLIPLLFFFTTSFISHDSVNTYLMNRETGSVKRSIRLDDELIHADTIMLPKEKDGKLCMVDNSQYRILIDRIVDDVLVVKPIDNPEYVINNAYVVMINSSTDTSETAQLFEDDISKLYDSFRSLDIPEERIFVMKTGPREKYPNSYAATSKDFTDMVAQLKGVVSDQDFLIVYFAGHGGRYYWISSDVEKQKPKYLSPEAFVTISRNINPKMTWLIYSPCHGYSMSGRMNGNIIGQSFVSEKFYASGGASQNLATILTAVAERKSYPDLDGDGRYSIEEIAITNALTYPNTLLEFVNTKPNFRREVHHLTYQDINPSKIFIK
jgi:hypothetical protein